jgi:hypothetical protein
LATGLSLAVRVWKAYLSAHNWAQSASKLFLIVPLSRRLSARPRPHPLAEHRLLTTSTSGTVRFMFPRVVWLLIKLPTSGRISSI